MCGIFGIITHHQNNGDISWFHSAVDLLFQLSESRGKEASGIAILSGKKIVVYKRSMRAHQFIQLKDYKNLLFSSDVPRAVIGHTRLATHGYQMDNRNNQPVVRSGIVAIHNGIVTNYQSLWRDVLHKISHHELDSEVIPELIRYYMIQGHSLESSTRKLFRKIEGSATVALLFDDVAKLLLATNTGSLFVVKTTTPNAIVFTSEAYILRTFLRDSSLSIDGLVDSIEHIPAGTGCLIDLTDISSTNFLLRMRTTSHTKTNGNAKKTFSIQELYPQESLSVTRLYRHVNSLQNVKQHDFDYERIHKLKRCVRCILPITMPFIVFDKNGVCNYCHNYKKIQYLGRDALEEVIAPYRKSNGEPDCIIAFSGGRDSSYGLHFLKKELNMHPIAYTYDWGMVTDVARRNEARLVGKLGVEHVIVSADIPMKRRHIQQHIKAWMNKPDLGMVPLFMEGDKQCEYYANQLMEKTGIQLMVYCRGNQLENEDFKHGHCGIQNPTPGGVIHSLSLPGKMQLALYYAKQYLINPSYINSSLPDTAFAYYSTFMMKHQYMYLWHYIPWDEDEIISTLKRDYAWETEKQNKGTWRTDDGTSAFYNYIYYQMQGFTENDTFRSNQIREGIVNRKDALIRVHEENKPRHKALAWYFDRIGMDADEVLTVVDAAPKLF